MAGGIIGVKLVEGIWDAFAEPSSIEIYLMARFIGTTGRRVSMMVGLGTRNAGLGYQDQRTLYCL